MPLFRIGSEIIYFAHVPKCGGTTIEQGLIDANLRPCLLDRMTSEINPLSVPLQHVDLSVLNALGITTLFDYSFSMIRHPVDRFVSAYRHNQYRKELRFLRISKFLERLRKEDYYRGKVANHFVPASSMLPENAKVFLLEEGFKKPELWLKSFAGAPTGLAFGWEKKADKSFLYNKSRMPSLIKNRIYKNDVESMLSGGVIKKVKDLYEEDLYLWEKHSLLTESW